MKKTFQRALQYCDPKKLHLALLGMYERTDQHKLADELLEKMAKKFKNSCKVFILFVNIIQPIIQLFRVPSIISIPFMGR